MMEENNKDAASQPHGIALLSVFVGINFFIFGLEFLYAQAPFSKLLWGGLALLFGYLAYGIFSRAKLTAILLVYCLYFLIAFDLLAVALFKHYDPNGVVTAGTVIWALVKIAFYVWVNSYLYKPHVQEYFGLTEKIAREAKI